MKNTILSAAMAGACLALAPMAATAAGNHPIYGIHFYGTGAENTIMNGKQMYSLEMLYTNQWDSKDKNAEKAKLQAIKDKGFTVILRLDYGLNNNVPNQWDWTGRYNFAVKSGEIASYMKDIVDIYVIGNETTTAPNTAVRDAIWNAYCFNAYDGNSVYDKIHLNDPVAIVCPGGLTGWPLHNDLIGGQNIDWLATFLDTLDKDGSNKPQVDGFSVHAYSGDEYFNNTATPTEDPRFSDVSGFNSFIHYLKVINAKCGTSKPVYITETNTYWMAQNQESDITYRANWIKEAFQTVNEWNRKSDQKIDGLIWYTYSHFNDPSNRDIWGNAMMRTDNALLNTARADFSSVTSQAAMVPGYPGSTLHFEAENYTNSAEWILDTGVQGTDYSDTDAANAGGEYRNGNHAQNRPDIGRLPDGSGFFIGWTPANEWLRYETIAGGYTYRLKVRYARGVTGTGSVTIKVDGASVGTVSLPATANWDTYATATGPTFTMAGGYHQIRLEMTSGNTNVDWFEFERANSVITLQAENAGTGNGTGYYDTTAGNSGGVFRSDDLDVAAITGGYAVGWVAAWEWLKFTNVTSTAAGSYTVTMRVATPNNSRACNIEINGADATGLKWFNSTGSFTTYQDINLGTVNLNAGANTVKLVMQNDSWNVDWIKFTPN